MRHISLTDFEKHTKKTRKEQLLEEMEEIVPWSELTLALEPCYPDPTGPGHHPKWLVRVQQRSEQLRDLARQRRQIVEQPFGTIKQMIGQP